MAGQIRKMIDSIIDQRSKGNELLRNTTETKLVIKGVNPSKYGASSPDDAAVIEKLRGIAKELGVAV